VEPGALLRITTDIGASSTGWSPAIVSIPFDVPPLAHAEIRRPNVSAQADAIRVTRMPFLRVTLCG
jgi:hypothetical protein